MATAVFRGLNLKLPAGAFREAIKRESPKRTREGQVSDPTGPVQATDYGSDDYSAAIGEQPVLITPDGIAHILPPGATPTEHPDTMGLVGEWDRDGIVRRFLGRKDWSAAVKPSSAEAAEWDHVQLSLTRQAGEEATPEQVKQAVQILTEVLRTPPLRFTRDGDPETYQRWLADKRITRGDVLGIDGSRMVHVLPVHDNTDHVHVQAFVHRHPIDVAKREVGAAIKQHEPIVARAQVAALNAFLAANDLPFTVSSGFDRINAGVGAVLDTEQAAQVVAAIEDAGGTAPARLTTGQQGQLSGRAATPVGGADVQRITESIDQDAQALARLKAESDALALRIAAKQHAVAAIQEAELARTAQAEAEALAQAAEAARDALQAVVDEEPERTALAVQEAVQPVQAALEEVREFAAGEPERIASSVAEAVTPVRAELEVTVARRDELESFVAGEPERVAASVAEAVAPVQAALEEVSARRGELEAVVAGEPERIAAEVQGALAPVEADRDAARAEAARLAAELAEERRTLPERIASAVREAVDREVANVRGVYDAAIAAKDQTISTLGRQVAGLESQVADLRDQVRALIERVANLPSAALQAVAGAATTAAQATRVGVTALRYYEAAPEDWTPQQRANAGNALVKNQAKSETFRALDAAKPADVDTFGREARAVFLRQQAQKRGPDGGTDEGPKGPR